VTRPFRVLDLYCCQGGAARGYLLAGASRVTGVDKDPQPRFIHGPFIQADAVAYVRDWPEYIRTAYDFVHASPPCQLDSDCWVLQKNDHPDLIEPTREALELTGLPYVIENVGGAEAKLKNPVMLCGPMLGLKTYRHRYFEAGGGFVLPQLPHPEHTVPQAKMGRPVPPGWYGQYVGNFSGVAQAREVMGVPWMNRDGIRECIPPAYSEWIGRQFLAWRTCAQARDAI
jgi:DNA (cytosine-5)-methyltransferase 1